MTKNYYIIDASSLIELNRNNPQDIFPALWKKVENLIKETRMVAPKEVLFEIKQKDDVLTNWAKKQKLLFKEPSETQIGIVRDLLFDYPALTKVDKEFDADPWVIALAIELQQNPQQPLFKIKRVIVTEETLRGNKIKIPFVAKQSGIESITIIDLFREEGWKF